MRNPFIAGSWVRGDNFFGRSDTLREVLDGQRHAVWVLGARRLGKTSPPQGARAARAAEPRHALRRPLLGPAGQRRLPRPGRVAPGQRGGQRALPPRHRHLGGGPGEPVRDRHAHHPGTAHGAQRLAPAPARGRGGGALERGPRRSHRAAAPAPRAPQGRGRAGGAHLHPAARPPERPHRLRDLALPPGLHPARVPDPPRPRGVPGPPRPRELHRGGSRPRHGAHGQPPLPRPAHRQPSLREPRPGGDARPGGGGRDGGQLLLRRLPDPRSGGAGGAGGRGARGPAHAPRARPGRGAQRGGDGAAALRPEPPRLPLLREGRVPLRELVLRALAAAAVGARRGPSAAAAAP